MCNGNCLKMEVLSVSSFSGNRKRDGKPFTAVTLIGTVDGSEPGKIVTYKPAAAQIKAGDTIKLQVVSRPSRFGAELTLDLAD